MCVYIAIIASSLQVTLWCMDGAAALKCNGYRLKSSLARHLQKGSIHWRVVVLNRHSMHHSGLGLVCSSIVGLGLDCIILYYAYL